MKRVFDVSIALLLALPLGIVYGMVWLLVRWKLGKPALFKQERPGLKGELFQICKFRTMTNDCDENGHLLPDSDRLTRFGRLLRSTSLDELPEFFNILKGEMSFVGPRPLLPEYLELYSARQSRRHEVRPGLTGWAQVNGRNAISWQQRLEMDVWYVENQSVLLDLKILLKTVAVVFGRKGVNATGEATVGKFQGNE